MPSAPAKFGHGPAAPDFMPQLVTAIASAGRQVAWPGKPSVLYNRDPAVTVYLGPEGFDPFGQAVHILDPLSSVPVDGTAEMWAQTQAGTAVVQASPRVGAITPSPAQIAAQIALSGVSLLARPTVIANRAAAAIAGSGTATLGPFAVTQIGYEIGLTLQTGGGATFPFTAVTLTWTDSVSGLVVAQETWTLGGSTAAPQAFCGTGPSKGDTLTITAVNLDPLSAVTFAATVTQNSRAYVRDDWRQLTGGVIPGFTNASYNRPGNVLLSAAFNVNAGVQAPARIIGFYAGRVALSSWSQNSLAGTWQVLDIGDSNVGNVPVAGGSFQASGIPANPVSFPLPRSQCALVITNTAAANGTYAVNVLIDEYAA